MPEADQLILSFSTKGLFDEQSDDKTKYFMCLGARLSASLTKSFFMDEGTVVTTNAVLSIKRINVVSRRGHRYLERK